MSKRPRVIRSVLFLVFAVSAHAQDDPLLWFPLTAGARWTYEFEAKSGSRNHPDIDRWAVEQTVTGRVTIQEGLVVLRQVKPVGDPGKQTTARAITPNGEVREIELPAANRAVLSAAGGEPYLVRDSCVYSIPHGWDARRQDLTAQYRQYLHDGALSPDFCFPLQMGRQWGNNDVPWSVEPGRTGVGRFLAPPYSAAIHIFSGHFGSGGWMDVWFQKGVGVVGEHYLHNGTYDEYTKKLVSFVP